MRQSFLTKYIGKRVNVNKEAEIVAKNLFRIHSEQKVIFIRLLERRIEPDSASCIREGKLRTARDAEIPPEFEFFLI
jgi:hypothetical protein